MENNQNKNLVLIQDLGMLYPKENSKRKARYGLYKCVCENEFRAMIQNIKRGHTNSCGCLKITHNLTNHRLYKIWNNIIDRCTNQKSKYYKDYGDRGINISKEWLDVNNFVQDMDSSYQEGLTIDRIDNNLGYSKENCRWTTREVQNRNTRKIRANNTSGYRGVCWHKSCNKWQSYIKVNSKRIHLGSFNTALEAAKAYDKYIVDNKLEHTKNI